MATTIGTLAWTISADASKFKDATVTTRKEMRAAEKAFQATRTPAENYQKELEALAQLHKKGAIDQDAYARATKRIEAELEDIERESRMADKSLKGLWRQAKAGDIGPLKRLNQAMSVMPSKFGVAALGANLASRAIIGLVHAARRAVSAMIDLAKSQIDEVDRIAKFANTLGFSTEFLHSMEAAAGFAGAEITHLRIALTRFNRSMGQAAAMEEKANEKLNETAAMGKAVLGAVSGASGAAGAFRKLGLSARELVRMNPEEAFLKTVQAMDQIPTRAEKVALGFKIFGKQTQRLQNFFDFGAEGLLGVMEEQRQLGNVFSIEEARRVENMNDNWARMEDIIEGLGRRLLVEFAPAFDAAFGAVSDAFKNLELSDELNRDIHNLSFVMQSIAQHAMRLADIFKGFMTLLKRDFVNVNLILEEFKGGLSEIGKGNVFGGVKSLFSGLGRVGDAEVTGAEWANIFANGFEVAFLKRLEKSRDTGGKIFEAIPRDASVAIEDLRSTVFGAMDEIESSIESVGQTSNSLQLSNIEKLFDETIAAMRAEGEMEMVQALQEEKGAMLELIAAEQNRRDAILESAEAQRQAEQIAKSNAEAIRQQIASLDKQILLFGQSAQVVSLYEASLKGASDAELEAINARQQQLAKLEEQQKRQQDIQSQIESVTKSAQTPMEKLAAEFENLITLSRHGLDPKVQFREARRIRSEMADLIAGDAANEKLPGHAGALEAGSAAAFSAVLAASREAAQGQMVQEKQLEAQQRTNTLLEQWARKQGVHIVKKF